MLRRGEGWPWLPAASVIAFGVTLLVLISQAPALLGWLAGSRGDWDFLANVGDAYAGVSAILSSLAFCGVAASLLLQWRQNRMTQLYSFKQQHLELTKLALQDPKFLYVDGVDPTVDGDATLKVYANLIVSHWAMAWDLRMMSVRTLRGNAARLFNDRISREWWEAWRFSYLSSRGRKRFVKILDEEYQRVVGPDASRLAFGQEIRIDLPSQRSARAAQPEQNISADALPAQADKLGTTED
ncbi:hypothetical protein GCM10022251_27690 [Phytohabitans flavus]|uniref:Uncharacterized protein n=1 Tax=Phytohabitans flavus TaxID=1076124 RepID=A0A6F8XP81_9ACTN|nr:DUF6082 family protein [Phytohabitans flavus]BCB75620.1 hypothetical protein Pflav_020300 [Phytohabitans flavus]